MNTLLNSNFNELPAENLSEIDGGIGWKEVTVAGGALLGGCFGPIGSFAGGLAAGAFYDWLF